MTSRVRVIRCLPAIAIAALTAGVSAQPSTSSRVCTTIPALRASPVFFHGKQIAVLGSVSEGRDFGRLAAAGSDSAAAPVSQTEDPGRSIFVYWRERPTRQDGEIRGEFWDLGRLTENDPRFVAYDFKALLEATTQGRWPARDQVFVLLGATLTEAAPPSTPTLRAITLSPERYEGKGVTISGRFRGRNLYADVAAPVPTPTKFDFVIQSADAAVWITNLRPRGKGFELDPNARVDTGRWVQITGIVRRDSTRTWIEGSEIELAAPPEETQVEVVIPTTPKEAPPSVVFSAPVPEEPEVEPGVVVRIQFSRDMDARSFRDKVRVTYQAAGTNVPPPPPPIWAFNYNVGNRGIELKFQKPLERFQTVRIDLLDGIKAIDGEPLKPWTLSFTTGR